MVSHWPAPHTHHQLPHPGARHPRLLPLTPPRLAVRPRKSPFPALPSLSTGDICNNHSTWSKVRGSPEPPHGCWEPRRVPTPGRSESSRSERAETMGDSGWGLGCHLTCGDLRSFVFRHEGRENFFPPGSGAPAGWDLQCPLPPGECDGEGPTQKGG